MKYLVLAFLLISIVFASSVRAADTNYVTPIFPVRAREYWRQGSDIKNFTALKNIVADSRLPATWLVQYDVLFDNDIAASLSASSSPSAEIGLFLEVTRKLADDSFVGFNWQRGPWSEADKLFLSGYTRDERVRMIDTAFSAFKTHFGYYPSTYGTWYIDVWSMEYIRDKYHTRIVLGLTDQYSTDGYQTWGQYFNLPYIVSKTSAIETAQNVSDSTGILKIQWAPREPLLGYGNSVNSSNFSAQVNDYARGKNLDSAYFTQLLTNITLDVPGKISQAVIGIETGELEEKYYPALNAQFKVLSDLKQKGQIVVTTAADFGKTYLQTYPLISPPAVIGSRQKDKSLWWYMNPDYRIALGLENNRLYIKDLRFYHQSPYRDNDQIEMDSRQNLVRMVPAVIDQVTLGNQLDLGPVKNITITPKDNSLTLRWGTDTFTATASGINLPIFLKEELLVRKITFASASAGLLITPPAPAPVIKQLCHSDYGNFAGKLVCLKVVIMKLAKLIPDLIYSRLESQSYFGLRTGFETFWGLRLPGFKISRFTFKFPVLNDFISLRKKLIPVFKWQGRQEYELQPYRNLGSVFEKGKIYGQEEINKTPAGKKQFENSYYTVYAKP